VITCHLKRQLRRQHALGPLKQECSTNNVVLVGIRLDQTNAGRYRG
jgi:hypothetical protein